MSTLKFTDVHNLVVFLSKPTESEGFEQIVDANPIKYALTVNPTVYTSCIEQFSAKTVNGEVHLQALVDGEKVIITESTVKRDLQLENAEGVDCLPNVAIFEQLTLMRVGKDFSRRETPLFPTMMVQALEKMGEGSVNPTDPHHTSTIIQPLTSQPQMKQKSRKKKRKETELPQTSGLTTNVADKAVNEEMDDSLERTATSLDAEQKRGVNTPRSGKDSLKLNELMELYTKLQQRVLDLETIKTTQALEIDSLKRRVNKLERRRRSRTYGLKRLYKIGLSARVESSEDEDMFGVNDLDGDEVIVENVDVAKKAKEVVDDITLAKALMEITSAKPKAVKVVIQEPEQGQRQGKMVEPEPLKKLSKKDQLMLDEELAFKLQAEEEEEVRITREKSQKIKEVNIAWDDVQAKMDVNTFVDFRTELVEESSKKAKAEITQEGSLKRARDELEQERSKKQKVEDDKESKELKKCLEIIPDDGDDVTIDAILLSSNKMLKFFDREDLEVLWRLVKARFKKVKPVDHMDSFLLHNLKTMFEHHVEDNNILYYLLVEKMYPLTNHTLHQMFNDVKLQVDYECNMAFELLRLVKKQLKEGYVSQ
nr:hypothetical protein [Tanacetum cinerariifolium]